MIRCVPSSIVGFFIMAKSAGICVFCGERRPLTKSHILPAWISTILSFPATHYEMRVGMPQTFVPTATRPQPESLKKPGHAAGRQPRNTCLECNSGWMRRIEEAARPVITPLLLGQPVLLEPIAQRLLASFLCLVAMRIEFSARGVRTIPQSHIVQLMATMQASEGWQIWIARYSPKNKPDNLFNYSAILLARQPPPVILPQHCNAQTSTIAVGQFCAHIFSTTIPQDIKYNVPLSLIWPPANFAIDVSHVPLLDRAQLIWLSEAILRQGRPVPGNEVQTRTK